MALTLSIMSMFVIPTPYFQTLILFCASDPDEQLLCRHGQTLHVQTAVTIFAPDLALLLFLGNVMTLTLTQSTKFEL